MVYRIKVVAILDTGSPVNVISSRLARKIKIVSNLDHSVVYVTAVMASNKLIEAYSIPSSMSKRFLTAPDVVLQN